MSAVPERHEFARAAADDDEPDVSSKRGSAARVLGEHLRQMRRERRLSLKDVAPVIRGSISKVSRLERGESPPKDRDVYDLLKRYRATPEEWDEVDRLLRQSKQREWWNPFGDVIPSFMRTLIGLESSAEVITTYEHVLVPGLLQTEAYARVLVENTIPATEHEAIKRRVAMKVSRPLHLADQRLRVLVDEAALWKRVGSAQVMLDQLLHLKRKSQERRVEIRIIPLSDGGPVSPASAFTHLHFGDDGPAEIVYVEQLGSAQYITRPAEVEAYRFALVKLMDVAAPRGASQDLLDNAIARYAAECGGTRPPRPRNT